MNNIILEFNNIYREYLFGGKKLKALSGIDLSIEEGDFLSIVGPSGSGKTTLLNLGCGIDRPTSGEIKLGGVSLTGLGDRGLSKIRNRDIGIIFQSFNLISVLTAYENIEYPVILNKKKSSGKERIEYLLTRTGMWDKRMKTPGELSGGEQQRVAIARALVNMPKVVFADEPTANLDEKNSRKILDLMVELNLESGTTFILATHDPNIYNRTGKSIRICDGKIEG